jgi:phosphopantetheinyl transferase
VSPFPLCTVLQRVPSVSEDLDQLAARHLEPLETALISTRSSPKRRAEFIAGRIAARAAVSRLLGQLPSSSSFLILREGVGPTGCPIVAMTGDSDAAATPHVSISHADGLAVAAACFGRVGIDLASVQAQKHSFVDDTFSTQEITQWAAWLHSERTSALTITTAFAAKEAALKWLGTGFALPLRAIEILPTSVGVDVSSAAFPVPTLVFRVTLIERGKEHPRTLSGRFARIDDRILIWIVVQGPPIYAASSLIATRPRSFDRSI